MRHFIALVLSAILLPCCGQKESSANNDAEEASTGWPTTRKTQDGSFAVTVKPLAGEIVENEHFSLDVTIAGENATTKPLQVKVDADMPAHQHGMNTQPEISAKGDLRYQVDGMLFHMAGEWVITVDVTRDGKTERASFPVQVE
jgi:hypothetical protein